MAEFIAYYLVSTSKQAQSGLGLEAQKQAVLDFINGNGDQIVAEFTEVESGKRCDRPELNTALNRCRETGGKLVIARLDRRRPATCRFSHKRITFAVRRLLRLW